MLAIIRWRHEKLSNRGEAEQLQAFLTACYQYRALSPVGLQAKSLHELLTQLDLTKFEKTFERAEIDLGLLLFITKDELKLLELPLGPRTTLERSFTHSALVSHCFMLAGTCQWLHHGRVSLWLEFRVNVLSS